MAAMTGLRDSRRLRQRPKSFVLPALFSMVRPWCSTRRDAPISAPPAVARRAGRQAPVVQRNLLCLRSSLSRRPRPQNHGTVEPPASACRSHRAACGCDPVFRRARGEPEAIFAAACEHGLEGVIFKDPDSPYRSDRSGDWLKVKCIQSESFFIVGYEKSAAARGGVGSLLLAAWKGSQLHFVGSVGTGFSYKIAVELRTLMDRLATKKPTVAYDGRTEDLVWVQPTLIAEIEYRAWTDDGKLRHASYKGLREVQDNAAVYRIAE